MENFYKPKRFNNIRSVGCFNNKYWEHSIKYSNFLQIWESYNGKISHDTFYSFFLKDFLNRFRENKNHHIGKHYQSGMHSFDIQKKITIRGWIEQKVLQCESHESRSAPSCGFHDFILFGGHVLIIYLGLHMLFYCI